MTKEIQSNFLTLVDSSSNENPSFPINGYRSGSFVDNMKLPIHRWFRFSAGFSAEWVESLLKTYQDSPSLTLLDPFAGSGTSLLAADLLHIKSIGIEAHPFLAKIAQIKLNWDVPISNFENKANSILEYALTHRSKNKISYPKLISSCFSESSIKSLYLLQDGWRELDDGSKESNLSWLTITSILRSVSTAGTAQWQYVLPNKKKKIPADPIEAYKTQVRMMIDDIKYYQQKAGISNSSLFLGDARNTPGIPDKCIDVVITSPPYANNYDYADATRLEMTFWGDVYSWGDLHGLIRNKLIVSSSQHASIEKLSLDDILPRENLDPIRNEITPICYELSKVRLSHGGKKHYHTMIAAYFSDLSLVFKELRRLCKPQSKVCFVIGDSAPYGVYVPVDKWLGELAIFHGFSGYKFEKLRDRNIKWKNRKHRVPLHEGRLWIEG